MQNFLSVRVACGIRIHPSSGDARALYVHERITHCSRESLKIPLSLVGNKCVVCACSVLTQHIIISTVQKRTELRRTVPSEYVLRTYNARCEHRPIPNNGRNKLTSTTLARTYSYNALESKNTLREQRLYVQPPYVNMSIAQMCKHFIST